MLKRRHTIEVFIVTNCKMKEALINIACENSCLQSLTCILNSANNY